MTEKQLLKFFWENEFDVQSANSHIFACDLVFTAYANGDPIEKAGIKRMFCFATGDHAEFYFNQIIEKKRLNNLAKNIYWKFLENPKNILDINKQKSVFIKKIESESFKKPIKDLNKEQINKLFEKILDLSKQWWLYGIMGEDKGWVVDIEIIPKFAKRHKISIEKARNIFQVFSHPDEQAIYNLERKAFWEICECVLKHSNSKERTKNNLQKILSNKKASKLIADYIKEYYWVKTDFFKAKEITVTYLSEEVLKEIKNKKGNDFRMMIKKSDDIFMGLSNSKKGISQGIKLDMRDKTDLLFAKLSIVWQDKRKEEMMKMFYCLYSVLGELANKIGFNFEDLVYYTGDEIKIIVKTGELLPRKKEKRIIVFKKNKPKNIYYGSIAEKMLAAVLKVKPAKEIKGSVASRGKGGKIKGVARIITDPKAQNFNKGDILVTSMTRIEYVLLMNKAKAIITDEGGISCHAAIVSRELGIPCIIGTKIATRVLKSGNLIEIDTDKGIIKVIK